jgi:hypothetical protein
MPSFARHGDYFVAPLITGPSSAMVRIRFTEFDDDVSICVLPLGDDMRFGNPDASSVRNAILEGVSSANANCGTSYKVAEIHYQCDNDGRCALMRRAAYCIVDRLAKLSDSNFTGA